MQRLLPLWILSLVLGAAAVTPFAHSQGLSPLDQPSEPSDAPAPPDNALDKDDLAFYVRHLYVYDDRIDVRVGDYKETEIPGLLETTVTASYKLASKEHTFYVSKDGKRLIEGQTYVIGENPFKKTNETMNTMAAPGFGKEGAPVVVVAYSDFQCPYCANEAEVLRNQLKNEYANRVRVYFRDFPLAMHNWAEAAAVAGRCIYEQEPEAFWAYHDWIFENQKSITPQNLQDKALAFAGDKELDNAKLAQCLTNKETLPQVEASVEEGRAVGVSSTPTLFVNGRRLSGSTSWEQLKAVIDYELKYQEITHNAGDDCGCAVELEFPQ